MKKVFTIFILLFNILYAFVDSDFDGVDDSIDKCPHSKLTDLVDKFGCKVKEIKVNQKEKVNYDLFLGYSKSYYKDSKESSIDLSLTIFYKNYSLYLVNSKYSNSNDSTIALFYKSSINENLYYKLGIGTYISSNSKNSFFSSVKLSYFLNHFDFSFKYKRVFNQSLNDNNFYEFCLGYNYKKIYLYSKISYESTIDKELSSTKLFTLGANYYLNNKIYFNLEYSKSINSDPFRYLSAGVGYSF